MSDTRPVLPIYALLLMAVGGASTLFFEAPFESIRPSVDPDAFRGDTFIGEAPTRLWQDPLGNARAEYQRREQEADIVCAEQAPFDPEFIRIRTDSLDFVDYRTPPIPKAWPDCSRGPVAENVQTILARMGVGRAAPERDAMTQTILLPVMVPGGYKEENAETRRRRRYSVLTALMSQGFSTLESDYIGYFVPRPKAERTYRQPEDRLVAWEVLNREDARYVAVLWMPQLLADEWPPTFLNRFLCSDLPGSDATGTRCPDGEVKLGPVIGPATSEQLIGIFRNALQPADDGGIRTFVRDPPWDTDGLPLPQRISTGAARPVPEALRVPLISTSATISAERMLRALEASRPKGDKEKDREKDETCGTLASASGMPRMFEISACRGQRERAVFSKYLQVLSDDGRVADTLIDELRQRGIDILSDSVAEPVKSVAIIGEADRVYTKTWVEEMVHGVQTAEEDRVDAEGAAAAARGDPDATGQAGGIQPVSWRDDADSPDDADALRQPRAPPVMTQYCPSAKACVLRFQYFGGLDGAQATRSQDTRSRETKGQLGVSPVDPELLARSIGDSQFDYLRRLADEVRTQHRDLRRTGGEGIRAVGVFGGDVYDKILILQALRQELPDAIFFTNDLDARLLHPANYRWTRNLIIASAYGLEMGPVHCRGGGAPFRDSYQTSAYVGTLLALKEENLLADPHMVELCGERAADRVAVQSLYTTLQNWDEPPAPRLFEVSRTGPVDITPGRHLQVQARLGGAPDKVNWFEADLHARPPALLHYLPIVLSVLILTALILAFTGRIDRALPALGPNVRWWREESGWFPFRKARDRRRRRHRQASRTFGERAAGLRAIWLKRLSGFPGAQLIIANLLAAVPFVVVSLTAEASTGPSMPPIALAALGLLPFFATLLVWRRHQPVLPSRRYAAGRVFRVVLALNVIVPFVACYLLSARSAYFEPALWLSGVSTWPTQLIRVFAAVLAIVWLTKVYGDLDQSYRQLVRDFFVRRVRANPRRKGFLIPLDWGLESELCYSARLDEAAERDGKTRNSADPDEAHVTHLSARAIQYARYMAGPNRTRRTLALGFVHFVAVGLLFFALGTPTTPARGIWAMTADKLALLSVVPLTIFAAMFVTDATRMCGRLVRVAASDRMTPDFSGGALARIREQLGAHLPRDLQERYSLSDEDLGRIRARANDTLREYARLDFIARVTQPVGRLIKLPFALIALLVISRSNLFDQWGWNLALIIAVLSLAFYSLLCAIRLRKGAEEARNRVMERLSADHRASLPTFAGGPPAGLFPDQIKSLMDVVENERRGAFNGWFKHPIIQAMLLPFGGAGAVALLDFVVTLG